MHESSLCSVREDVTVLLAPVVLTLPRDCVAWGETEVLVRRLP